MPNESELGWCASTIDCEGAIMIGRRVRSDRGTPQWQLRITVTNTDARVCAEMARLFGGGIYGPYQNKVKGSDPSRPTYGKPWWSWEVSNHKAAVILRQLQPYMISKGEQATIALQFAATLAKGGRKLSLQVIQHREALKDSLVQAREAGGR